MDQQRRRLPHVRAEGNHLFVTWQLYGSLPYALYPPPNKQNTGRAFVWMDRYLDSARVGPLYLKQQPIAQLVVDSIRYGAQHLQYYDLQPLSSWRTMCTYEKRIGCSDARASHSGKGGILRPLGARRTGIGPHQGVH